MDPAIRWTLLGLCAMGVVVVAPRMDDIVATVSNRLNHETTAHRGLQTRDLYLDRRFDLQPGGTLTVDVPDGDVSIATSRGGRASVEVFITARDREWGRTVFERMKFEAIRSGNDLRVTATSPRLGDYDWGDGRGVDVRVEIAVPQRFDLDIASSDGDISINDVAGQIDLRTADGDVTLGNARGPAISISTSDGDVSAESIETDELVIQTHDGDVYVAANARSSRITTGDGDIQLDLMARGEVRLRTGDGDITIYGDHSLAADVELRGDDVQVGSEYSLEGRLDRRGALGQLNGGGPLLLAETGDGTISIRSR
jgi:hypothetical protein